MAWPPRPRPWETRGHAVARRTSGGVRAEYASASRDRRVSPVRTPEPHIGRWSRSGQERREGLRSGRALADVTTVTAQESTRAAVRRRDEAMADLLVVMARQDLTGAYLQSLTPREVRALAHLTRHAGR